MSDPTPVVKRSAVAAIQARIYGTEGPRANALRPACTWPDCDCSTEDAGCPREEQRKPLHMENL